MSVFIEKMNDNQREAILHCEGPLMIIAGAGSGKTRVLTHRIAYLIGEKKVFENNILAITFTNKAAKEMKERIYDLVGNSAKYIWINTFHSMCVRILRSHIDLLDYNRNFTILDVSEQKTIVKNILQRLNYSTEEYEPLAILKIISNAKNKYEKPSDMEKRARFGFMKTVSEVYYEYQRYLKKNSVLDFDDLLIKTIDLFEEYPQILEKYQNQFKYIHVDEYQDTNVIQYKLVRMLSAIHNNVCVVGDDDQSIYSWRGACIDNIRNFENDFKNTKLIFLDQNYRSNSTILNIANAVIKNNNDRKVKNLWSENQGGNKVEIYAAYNDIDEAEHIVKNINNLVNEGIEYKDIAILYRANYLSRTLENCLLSSRIPYKIIGSLKFLQRQEVKDIIAYLNVLVNRNDDLSLNRIINVPRRGIGAVALEKIENYALSNNISLYAALKNIDNISVSKKINENIKKLVAMFETYNNFEDYSIDEIIVNIYEKSGYKEMLLTSKDDYAESRVDNISELVTSAKQYSEINNNLVDYISEMSLTSDSDDIVEDNSVILSTVHAAKGLEYEAVFIIGMEENIFPSIRDIDDLDDEIQKLEEERRLAYVAITRAKERLFLSYTNRRMQFGNVKFNDKSRFIKEIPEQLSFEQRSIRMASLGNSDEVHEVKKFISKLSPKIKEKTSKSSGNTLYNIGEKVSHKKFGKGVITDFEKDSVVVVFEEHGEKKLILEYANLSKEQ